METQPSGLNGVTTLQTCSGSKTTENPKDKLIKGLAAFVRVNTIECTQKNAADIAKWAVQRYQEQTGAEVNQMNWAAVMPQIIDRDLACLKVDDIKQEKLIRKFVAANYSPDSEIYQSCNHLLIWFIKSKTGMNDSLTLNLVEVLWEKVIQCFRSLPNSQCNLGCRRLHNLLIKKFLNYTTAQTSLGPRQRIGMAENLAVNRIFTKAIHENQASISILKDYLYEKLPPIFSKEYQGPEPEIHQLVNTVIPQVLHDIVTKKCNYDPEIQKSFLVFVLKNYLEIRPIQIEYPYNIDDMIIGKEDQKIDEVIAKDEFRAQRSVKLNTLTEVFGLVLRCGGYPHEQLSYLFIDFLATKPDKMVEKGLHETALNELRESFWHQIGNRLSQYYFDSQKFLIFLDPLDRRLKMKVNTLTSLVNNNEGKIAVPVKAMDIAQTRLSDYHTFSKRDINMAISFWKDNVRQSLARVLGVPSLDFNKMIYSPALDKTFKVRRKISRNQCKLKEIAPCGGEKGTGCLVFEVVKTQRLKKL
jgi:hypothetical protein